MFAFKRNRTYTNDVNTITKRYFVLNFWKESDFFKKKIIYRTEAHLYGSSRLGMDTKEVILRKFNEKQVWNPFTESVLCLSWEIIPETLEVHPYSLYRGNKRYELINHLGNVLAVISDKLLPNVNYSQDGDTQFGTKNHLFTADVVSATDYYAFGMVMPGRSFEAAGAYRYGFNGKEKEDGINIDNYDFGARIYDGRVSRWLSVDSMAQKYPSISPFVAFGNMPISLIDEEGEEPIKPLAAKVDVFINLFNNTPSKMGQTRGEEAHKAMLRLANTEWSWKQFRPLPVTTPYFNNRKGRYLYTEKGGWIDMTHFLFYAGKAYGYKLDKEEAQRQINDPTFGYLSESRQLGILERAAQSPIGEALQDGFFQEYMDPSHSSYSYEDLPSDKFGADFAVNHFDPQSKLTFGEQMSNYLTNVLKATDPEKAPNYSSMPEKDSKKPPSRQNKTTTPVYTTESR